MSISTNDKEQSYFSLFKEVNTHKCSPKKKCPCPLWINCSYYINRKNQQSRLNLKSLKNNNEISEWYLTYFRFEGELHNLYCSG